VFVLVAANNPAGRAIHPAQPVLLPAHQDAMHRRGGHVQPDGDPYGTELRVSPQRLDLSFHSRWRPARAVERPRAPVEQTGVALLHVPMPPLARRCPRHPISPATCVAGRPCAMRRTRISLPTGVSTALGWDTGEPPSGWISTTQTQPGGSLFFNNVYGHYTYALLRRSRELNQNAAAR
jgi:hypothetical protein